jgi:hypothetical protein
MEESKWVKQFIFGQMVLQLIMAKM